MTSGRSGTLYFALTGRPPYDVGENVLGGLYKIVHDEPPQLPDDHPLAGLLAMMMVKDPEQRWTRRAGARRPAARREGRSSSAAGAEPPEAAPGTAPRRWCSGPRSPRRRRPPTATVTEPATDGTARADAGRRTAREVRAAAERGLRVARCRPLGLDRRRPGPRPRRGTRRVAAAARRHARRCRRHPSADGLDRGAVGLVDPKPTEEPTPGAQRDRGALRRARPRRRGDEGSDALLHPGLLRSRHLRPSDLRHAHP